MLGRHFTRKFRSRAVFFSAPFVMIDVDPSGIDEWHDAMLGRCEAVLGVGQCQLIPALDSDATPPSSPAPAADSWSALVRWGDSRFVTVEVEVRNEADGMKLSSPAQFTDKDRIDERWASVGLLIAAMVTAHHRLERPEETDPISAPPPKQSPPPPTPQLQDPPVSAWLGVAALGSQGVASQRPLLGGQAQVGVRLPTELGFSGSVGYLSAPDQLHLESLRGELAAGYRFPIAGQFHLEPQVGFQAERIVIKASSGMREDRHVEWLYGPQAEVALSWVSASGLGLTVGVHCGVARPLEVEVLGRASGSVPTLRLGLLAGLRYQLASD